jgi:hypothetical protein
MADGSPPPPLQLEGHEVAGVTGNLFRQALNAFPPAIYDDAALAAAIAGIVRVVEKQRPGCDLRTRLRNMLDDPRV